MENKIVVHMKGGTIHKGITQDFDPDLESFHVLPAEGGGVPIRVRLTEMKALFWVKDYIGNRDFIARRRFDETDERHRAIATKTPSTVLTTVLTTAMDRLLMKASIRLSLFQAFS